MKSMLPVDDYLKSISQTLSSGNNVILVAEPGSGKTTRVPPYLLEEEWLKGKKILMLEPRRLATKAAARFISSRLGEKLGERVGYRIRGESRISDNTRLEVITEGLLTRMLQEDPALEEVGLIIFDEFHERSIHADLALALTLDSIKHLRPDLRIMVMSATIDAEAVSKLIGNAKIIKCPGRQYPVEIHYGKPQSTRFIESTVVDAVKAAHSKDSGDILVFLPGRAEINRVFEKLKESKFTNDTEILQLHSDIRGEEQDRILSPGSNDLRRIILSTNVAETSVTIPRVRIVIDSGLMRVPRFNPHRGVSGLETVTVSSASASQRTGRAGREAAGICYRLWTENEQKGLTKFNQPEIIYADLAPFLLELSAWGNIDTKSYSLMNSPPENNITQAIELLRFLGAIDENGAITNHGKELLRLSIPPRLSHMLLLGKKLGAGQLACDIAALLEEPVSSKDRELNSIVSNQLENLKDRPVRRIEDESKRLYQLLGQVKTENQKISAGVLIAFAYPDRISRQREPGSKKFLMRNGSGAIVKEGSPFLRHEYIVIADLDGLGENAKVFLGEPIAIGEIKLYFKDEISYSKEIFWSDENKSVRAREFESLNALTLSEKAIPSSDDEALPVLMKGIRSNGLQILSLDDESKALLQRTEWIRAKGIGDSLPDMSENALISDLENWLLPHIPSIRSINDIKSDTLNFALKFKLSRNGLKLLDEVAPSHFTLPSGRAVEISYDGPRSPSISGRLQEMFGQAFTPKICRNSVPLTIELLSPAGRPLQVTSDLESFWSNSYQEVRKEMAGRYPKHSWPPDPREAAPMRGVKKLSAKRRN